MSEKVEGFEKRYEVHNGENRCFKLVCPCGATRRACLGGYRKWILAHKPHLVRKGETNERI